MKPLLEMVAEMADAPDDHRLDNHRLDDHRLDNHRLDIRPMGDRAIVVALSSLDDVHRLAAAVSRAGLGVDVVPSWRRLLITTEGDIATLAQAVRLVGGERIVAPRPRELTIEVYYDGIDLHDVATITGMSVAEVITRHTEAEYTVAFLGFSRAFPYLAGLDPRLDLPRLATPRSRVAAGSVGIIAGACGIYPTASPGGWRLIGQTDAVMFDEFRDPPSMLQPGDRVRFRAVSRPRLPESQVGRG